MSLFPGRRPGRASGARLLAVVLCLLAPLLGSAPASASGWAPVPGQSWQWVLSTSPTAAQIASGGVRAWDLDGDDTPAATVAAVHAARAGAVCYLSAGSWESWRPDAESFPAPVKGRGLDGWAGERWLDIRQGSVLQPLMRARMETCRAKGFDAVEPDNVDGWSNATGFPLSAADQLAYNRMLANTAHALGLRVALKNDVDQVVALEPAFDFALNEECYAYSECGAYAAFRSRGKAVWVVEYASAVSSFCPQARAAGFDAMKKRLSLTVYRVGC